MGAPFTLAELLQPLTLGQLRARYLALLQSGGFPAVTEWAGAPLGPEMNFVNMVVQGLNDLANSGAPADKQIARMAAAGFLGHARGVWLTVLAERFYRLTRPPATRTTFKAKLVSVTTAPPYTFDVGDVWLVAPSGNRYQSTSGGDLPPGGSLTLDFAAENEGSRYADNPTVVAIALATAPAGVSLQVAGGDFTEVIQTGSSTGRIEPARAVAFDPLPPASFAITITASGQVGAATYAVSIGGGAPAPGGVLLATGNEIEDANVVFAAHAGGSSPSFVVGDTFLFATPGTPSYVQGRDEETDASLAARCRGRWPALSANVLEAKATLWTLAAYPGVNRIQVSPDTLVPGRFLVRVADPHGGVDQAVLNTIEAFIVPKLGTGEGMSAVSAANRAVTTAGNVKVRAQDFIAVQQEAQAEWVAALAGVDMAGKVLVARLEELLMDAGAVDVGDVTPLSLNGVAADLQLGAGEVPIDGNPLALAGALTWMVV